MVFGKVAKYKNIFSNKLIKPKKGKVFIQQYDEKCIRMQATPNISSKN